MNPKFQKFAQCYVADLRFYVNSEVSEDILPAKKLRRKARSIGIDLLEMARIHELAVQARMDQLNNTLILRTAELASAHRDLTKGTIRREKGEIALKKCNEHDSLLLKQSHHLQDGLHELTQQLLGAQEKFRRKYSAKLENELTQTLVGVNVRLLNFKKKSHLPTSALGKQIASTQKTVAQSARSVRRVAKKLTNP